MIINQWEKITFPYCFHYVLIQLEYKQLKCNTWAQIPQKYEGYIS